MDVGLDLQRQKYFVGLGRWMVGKRYESEDELLKKER